MKLLLAVVFVAVLGGYYAATPTTQPEFDVAMYSPPGRLADVWRVLVLAQAGIAIGFLSKILFYFFKVKKGDTDRLLKPTALICFVYFGMMLYIGLDLASRVDFTISHPGYSQYLTWRTPAACFLFLVSDIALFQLMRRVAKMLGGTTAKDSTVKLTLTEQKKGESTSVDLSSGDVVTRK